MSSGFTTGSLRQRKNKTKAAGISFKSRVRWVLLWQLGEFDTVDKEVDAAYRAIRKMPPKYAQQAISYAGSVINDAYGKNDAETLNILREFGVDPSVSMDNQDWPAVRKALGLPPVVTGGEEDVAPVA